jgi:hypothetical protein
MNRSLSRPLVALFLSALAAGCAPLDDSAADEDPGDPLTEPLQQGAHATVETGPGGHLDYTADPRGDTIPDFSTAGYHGGGVKIPAVPVVRTVTAVSGDNHGKLQAAIDAVSALPRAQRGAILLKKGVYHLSAPLVITASGVVLRGEGEGATGTVLLSTTKKQITLVQFRGQAPVTGGERAISDDYVPVGARSFHVHSSKGLAVGDTIFVHRPATAAWIHDLGMDHLPPRKDGGPVTQWTPARFGLDFDRVITAIQGKRVTVDAPLTNALDAQYGGGTVVAYDGRSIEEVGVEHLRGDTVHGGGADEDHAWSFVSFEDVKNGWAAHVTAVHFAHAAVSVGEGSKWVTVRKATSLDPISQFTGERRYAFEVTGAQLVLVEGCHSEKGRHDFVTGATTVGPNVFLDGLADSPGSEIGPHQRWATGTLYDGVVVKGGALSAYDRGNMGSGHGWAGVNHVFWNGRADTMDCAEPPTAHNWSFGAVAQHHEGDCEWHSFGKPEATKSLYRAQLRDRLGDAALAALDAP